MRLLWSNSIKKNLQISLLSLSILVALLLMLASYLIVRHEMVEQFDGNLSQTANFIYSLSEKEIARNKPSTQPAQEFITLPPAKEKGNYERYYLFQVINQEDQLIGRSQNAPTTLIEHTENRFIDTLIEDNKFRVYSLTLPNSRLKVIAAQSYHVRNETITQLGQSIALLLLVALPIILWLVKLIVDKGLLPLKRVVDDIDARSPANLAPINDNSVPQELTSTIKAMNRLFNKVTLAMENEKRFTAEAAHELRTPLAGIKAQAQIALTDETRVKASLIRISEGIERTSQMLEKLLTLSRIDSQTAIEHSQFNFHQVLQLLCSELNGEAQKNNIHIQLMGDEHLQISTDKSYATFCSETYWKMPFVIPKKTQQ